MNNFHEKRDTFSNSNARHKARRLFAVALNAVVSG